MRLEWPLLKGRSGILCPRCWGQDQLKFPSNLPQFSKSKICYIRIIFRFLSTYSKFMDGKSVKEFMGNYTSKSALRYFTNVIMPKHRTVAIRAAARSNKSFLAQSCLSAEELCLRLTQFSTQLHQLNANPF
jgi:hypothetical protein